MPLLILFISILAVYSLKSVMMELSYACITLLVQLTAKMCALFSNCPELVFLPSQPITK